MLDDDRPDYFLSDEKADGSKQADPTAVTTAKDSKTIDFGGPVQEHEPEKVPEKKPRHRARKVLVIAIAVAVVVLAVAFWIRYLTPYAEDASARVYVVNVEKRGIIFKTWEAQVVSVSALADTTAVYSHPQDFSLPSEQIARQLQQYQGTRTPVVLYYDKYYATLPWRGAAKQVVTSFGQ